MGGLSLKSTKIFISAGPTDKAQNDWAMRFAEAIKRAGHYEDAEVYLYLKQRAGSDIPQEVRSRIIQARRMICLIGDHYLESGWCALEHFLFHSKGPEFHGNCVGVILPSLHGWVGEGDGKKKRKVNDGIETMRESRKLDISFGLNEHLTTGWTDWLVNARHSEVFHDFKEWPDELDDVFTETFRELAEPSSPSDRLLERCASLAAYAVAADRYHDGGWGFSLGSSFDYDDYGGDEQPRGRYDLNAVILHALSQFLEDVTLANEWEAIFGDVEEGRQPRVRVGDRLPLLAGLLASLSSGEGLKAYTRIHGVTGQQNGSLADSRWILEERRVDLQNFDYSATLLVCLTRLIPAIRSFPKGIQQELNAAKTSIERSWEHAEISVAACIRENNLFAAALASAEQAVTGSDSCPSVNRDYLRLAALWLLLTMTEDTAGQLGRELTRRVGRGDDTDDGTTRLNWTSQSFEQLFAAFGKLIETEKPDPESISLMLVCAAVLSSEGINIKTTYFETIQLRVFALLRRPDCVAIILSLNVMGWISLILFALRSATKQIDISLLQFMWREGRNLREQRKFAIQGKAILEIRGAIDEQVRECAGRVYAGWSPSREPSDVQAPSKLKSEAFLDQLRKASFWGPAPCTNRRASVQAPEGAFLSGVLRVRAKTKQVELETPGYNQMFLHPFSEITGMDISNLRNLRREFGDQDADLVRLMGETVVSACYERFKEEFIPSSRTFEERTQYITSMLTSREWDRTRGFDDLLIIKRGLKGERWVYRSALIHQAPGRQSEDDTLISWRFAEMPQSIEQLITKGSRIERLSNDRRPSA